MGMHGRSGRFRCWRRGAGIEILRIAKGRDRARSGRNACSVESGQTAIGEAKFRRLQQVLPAVSRERANFGSRTLVGREGWTEQVIVGPQEPRTQEFFGIVYPEIAVLSIVDLDGKRPCR